MAASKMFKPQSLRSLLIILLILAIAYGAGVFYLGLKEVSRFSVEVNNSIADAEASKTQIQQLQAFRKKVADGDDSITKADQILTTSAGAQAQANADIRAYAAATGITITKITFEPTTPGVNPSLTVGLQSPVPYANFIQFLDNIERNVPKLNVSGIGIERAANSTSNSVTVNEIKITIATRQ
jgi:type II secretory pathway component PulM